MGNINSKLFDFYVNELYKGDLERYKKKQKRKNFYYSLDVYFKDEEKIKRIHVSSSRIKDVLDVYNNKCVICGEPCVPDNYEIHHVNGNRNDTYAENNLVPMCLPCYKKVNTKSKSKLKDYINKEKQKTHPD